MSPDLVEFVDIYHKSGQSLPVVDEGLHDQGQGDGRVHRQLLGRLLDLQMGHGGDVDLEVNAFIIIIYRDARE